MEETIGKDLVLTAQDAQTAVQRTKPHLIQVGKDWLSSDGKVHPDLMATYVAERPREWIQIGRLARVFTGANTTDGKRRVRRHFGASFRAALDHGHFLLREVGKNGRIERVKTLDVASPLERQHAADQLERMRHDHEISGTKYNKALDVIALLEKVKEPGPDGGGE